MRQKDLLRQRASNLSERLMIRFLRESRRSTNRFMHLGGNKPNEYLDIYHAQQISLQKKYDKLKERAITREKTRLRNLMEEE